MSDRACPSIALALTKNSVLEHLMLKSNGITEAGTQTLTQALQINRTLKHLSLMVRTCEFICSIIDVGAGASLQIGTKT